MPTVSVIIPTYGHAEFILETLDSVFQQTFRDFEVLVVNDGSPDHTAEVLAPLAQSGRIRYFEQRNQGVAAARNFGISQAAGTYIALLDDDDLWPPDKLAWQVKYLTESAAIAVGGGAEILNQDGGRQKFQETEDVDLSVESFFSGNPFYSPGQVLFRKAGFDSGARFDITLWGVDDLDYWVELAAHGPFKSVGRLALIYRLHDSNASKDKIRMLNNCEKFLEKRSSMLSQEQLLRCRLTGSEWLFKYLGRRIIWDLRRAVISPRPQFTKGFRLACALINTFMKTRCEAPETYRKFLKELRHAFFFDLRRALVVRLRRFKGNLVRS